MTALHKFKFLLKAAVLAALVLPTTAGAQPKVAPTTVPGADNDVPAKFAVPKEGYDYVRRVEMIPMRDGVKLYTVIWVPKRAKDAPIVLTRTPYNAAKHQRGETPNLLSSLSLADEDFVAAGYIRVYQDIRGKYGSEGPYLMTRPPIGPLNQTKTDDTTDAWDTVDWLVKHLPESNGKVGMIGSSYEGWTVVMALLGPHPALKAAVPRARWSMAGWATTGSTTAPSASRGSTISRARPARGAEATTCPAGRATTTKTSSTPARRAPSPRPTAWSSCPGGPS